MSDTLHPNPPYAFDRLLDFLSRFAYPTLNIVHDGAYRRVFRVDGDLALVEVRATGTMDQPALAVEVLNQTGPVASEALLAQVRQVLAVREERGAFFQMARHDEQLWGIVEPVVGLPALRTADVYEALTEAVIEQQILWTAAQRAQRWLVEWGGHRIAYEGERYYAFPTPEQLAQATVDTLKPLKITFRRMQLLIDLAGEIVAGRLDLSRLAQMPPEDAYDELLAIKGIGHWTAAVTLSRANGRSGYVGHNDVALQAAVNHYFYGENGRISAETVRETFERYGEFAGVAAFYVIARWVLDRY